MTAACKTCGGTIEPNLEQRVNCQACRARVAERRRRARAGVTTPIPGLGEKWAWGVKEATHDTYTRDELLAFRARTPHIPTLDIPQRLQAAR